MTNIKNEKGNVNPKNEINDNAVKVSTKTEIKKNIKLPKEENLIKESEVKKEDVQPTSESLPNNEPDEKDAEIPNQGKKPSRVPADLLFVQRKNAEGKRIIYDYRREGSDIYKWTGEYWQLQDEDDLKSEIGIWLRLTCPLDFYSRTITSVFTTFRISMLKFDEPCTNGIIIPTKGHWLKITNSGNGKKTVIRAIKPCKSEPMKYQVNVTIDKEGFYNIPAEPIKGTTFEKFLNTSQPGANSQKFLAEFSGYSLSPSVIKQLMVWHVGNGGNGKSVYMEILTALHGNPVAVRLEEVGKYNSHLSSASLIYATEVKKSCFDQEFVKAAVCGEMVELRGIYSKKLNAKLNAKWVLLMNNLPHIDDFSDGLFRRTVIMEWNAKFDESNRDENLVSKVLKDELHNVLNWCLQGMVRMMDNNWKFTEVDECKLAMDTWKVSSDKVRMFVSEQEWKFDDEKKDQNSKDKEFIFKQYNTWASTNNFEEMNSTAFWLRMNNIFPKLKEDPNHKKNGRRAVYLFRK